MKATRIAVIILITLTAAVFSNSFYIGRITSKLSEKIEAVNTESIEGSAEEYEKIFNEFKNAEKFISLTVSHDDLTNIEEGFAELIGSAGAGLEAEMIKIKSRLIDSLEHLGRLSGVKPDSIL